ncbi:S1C family serine protease [Myxococcota bacterium]|nr:S1C family serine protease [Myxococcota bacterium]
MILVCAAALLGFADGDRSLRETFKRVNPSVVVIHTLREDKTAPVPSPSDPAIGAPPNQGGIGSGVLLGRDGRVLTAAHVIQQADHIEVEFFDGQKIFARVVAAAPAADIAMLELERVPDGAVPARLGDSDEVEPGDPVFAIGAPYGARHSLAAGWISARRSSPSIAENLSVLELFQIDMSLYHGNSGGPLFDREGRVVGIVTHVLANAKQSTGPGFAVTSNTARRLMLEDKRVWIGLETWLVEGPLARAFNVPQASGLMVQSVAAGSLGARLGLEEGKIRISLADESIVIGGDVILSLCGVDVEPAGASFEAIQRCIDSLRSGDTLRARVLRGGRALDLTETVP